MQNKWPIDYAHLPRVQTPVHINMLDMEFLEYTIKGWPQDLTKIHKIHWITSKLNRASLKWSNFTLFYMHLNTEHMVTVLTKNWQNVEIFT